MISSAFSLILLCLASLNVPAEPAPPASTPPTIEATSLNGHGPIHLDGVISEPCWQSAKIMQGFVQREPNDGAPATYRTEARLAYDAASLYIAVQAFDPEPEKIVGLLTRRDTWSPSDWISVVVDSYHDHRTAYEFAVNPAGVKVDRYYFNDGWGEDGSWDAVWDVEVVSNTEGWAAEFRIPFSQLRFRTSGSPDFGIAVIRSLARFNETSSWPHLPKSASGIVSSFGDIKGLELTRPPERLEAIPYSIGRIKTSPESAGNPFVKGRDAEASAGLDFKYALTPGLTLTGTLNPDFGQVEADPAVLNLSAFETFFAERRPFFVEGSGVFRFDIDCSDGECTGLFYSRRIGRRPQIPADEPAGGFSFTPPQTTILGAAKLTGRIGGFSVGALNALTAAEHTSLAENSSRYKIMAEPSTHYSVGRARREFADQSSLGFMVTATNRRLTDPIRTLPEQAYTGGVDWDWRLGKLYSLSGYWAGSTVHGDAEAIDRLQRSNTHSFQRPDAGHIDYDPSRTALHGHSLALSMNKIGGEKLRFSSNVALKSPGFDINDLGYMRRADEQTISNWLQWRRDKPSRHLRSFRINFNQWAGWNLAGDRMSSGGNINAHADFKNNWRSGAGINLNARGFSDRLTRGGPGGLRNGNFSFWHYLNTDNRKKAYGSISLSLMNDLRGTQRMQVSPSITVRPGPTMSLGLGVRYSRNHDDAQWLENVSSSRGDRYVFGRLQQNTLSMTVRVNYTITPTLSLQVYAEPYVSTGDYTNLKELVNGRANRYTDRYAPYAYRGNPDFRYLSFRTTNVLRWEYRPGSTLFVVWQQGREDHIEGQGDFRFGRDFGGVFGAPAHNVLLVKLAYWLNF